VPALEDWGVPDAHIHFEAFGPASIKRRRAATSPATIPQNGAEDAGIVVTFAQSGKQFPWQPAAGSLLEFAEANGIAVDSGCRAGGLRHLPDDDPGGRGGLPSTHRITILIPAPACCAFACPGPT
jgi:hypothetical protein